MKGAIRLVLPVVLALWLSASPCALSPCAAAADDSLINVQIEAPLSKRLPLAAVHEAAQTVVSRLGVDQRRPAQLRLLTRAAFRERTGAPWATAMFSGGQILIPAGPALLEDEQEFKRTIVHEYTHAVVAQLSDYRCPAWLDEGLAQLLEGGERPDLERALRTWLKRRPLIPLAELRSGFLKMPAAEAKVAYAQSFFAARVLIDECGFPAVRRYLAALKADQPDAFEGSFGLSIAVLEQKVAALFGEKPTAPRPVLKTPAPADALARLPQ